MEDEGAAYALLCDPGHDSKERLSFEADGVYGEGGLGADTVPVGYLTATADGRCTDGLSARRHVSCVLGLLIERSKLSWRCLS